MRLVSMISNRRLRAGSWLALIQTVKRSITMHDCIKSSHAWRRQSVASDMHFGAYPTNQTLNNSQMFD
jgi:hypothetical protein